MTFLVGLKPFFGGVQKLLQGGSKCCFLLAYKNIFWGSNIFWGVQILFWVVKKTLMRIFSVEGLKTSIGGQNSFFIGNQTKISHKN